MGWWPQDTKGRSFFKNSRRDMVWGDGPADIMDKALAEIDGEFQETYGRPASREELRAGLLFSLGGDDRPDHAPFRERVQT